MPESKTRFYGSKPFSTAQCYDIVKHLELEVKKWRCCPVSSRNLEDLSTASEKSYRTMFLLSILLNVLPRICPIQRFHHSLQGIFQSFPHPNSVGLPIIPVCLCFHASISVLKTIWEAVSTAHPYTARHNTTKFTRFSWFSWCL